MIAAMPTLVGLVAEQLHDDAADEHDADDPYFSAFLEQFARREATARRRRWEEFIRDRGRYAGATFESFECAGEYAEQMQRAVRLARDFAAGLPTRRPRRAPALDGGGLILAGPVGTGKDHLQTAIARFAIRDRGLRCAWTDGQAWFGRLRDAMSTGELERDLVGRLAAADVLFLSDPVPPSGALTDYQQAMLWRLVDARYNDRKPTIVSMNADNPSEAAGALTARTWDRLVHGAVVVACHWPSARRPAKYNPANVAVPPRL